MVVIHRLLTIALCLCGAACSSPPKTGAVQTVGGVTTFVYTDGTRYEGSFSNGARNGPGTLIYEYAKAVQDSSFSRTKEYDQHTDPGQYEGMRYTTNWKNNAPGATATIKAPSTKGKACGICDTVGFTYEGPVSGWSTKGQGRAVFADGRVFEGQFDRDTEVTPYTYYSSNGYDWGTAQVLGSKISGAGTMRWPDGTVFVGVVYDYYLFNRNVFDFKQPTDHENACTEEQVFIGQGTLRKPGLPDHVGYVRGYQSKIGPVEQDTFDHIVDMINSCRPNLLAFRRGDRAIDEREAAKMAEGRRAAHAMLMRDLAAMPAKNAAAMAQIGAASRGTTVEAEQAAARRKIEFQARVAEQQEAAQSGGQTSSSPASPTVSTSTTKTDNAKPAPLEALSVDNNPYAVDQRPNHWHDKTVAPWHIANGLSAGGGWTRDAACQDATRRGNDTMRSDRQTKLVTPTSGLTECVCHNDDGKVEGVASGKRSWACYVYYQYK